MAISQHYLSYHEYPVENSMAEIGNQPHKFHNKFTSITPTIYISITVDRSLKGPTDIVTQNVFFWGGEERPTFPGKFALGKKPCK